MNKILIMNKNMTRYVRSVNDGEENYYTKVDNRLIKSEHLSCEEKMIIIHCLSQNDSYVIIKEVLRNQLGLGVKRFTKAWKNLEKLGYIEDCGQTLFNGQFGGKQFVIHEYPDTLKKLDSFNTPSNQNITGEICSTEVASDAVGTLVHDGKALNVKSTDGKQIDAYVYNEKVTSNNYQGNQDQGNQDQVNQIYTNDFDENQNSWADLALSCFTNRDYNQEAKNYIEDFISCEFYYGWDIYEREIKFKSNEDKEYFENFIIQDKAWISKIYLWVLFVNERYFNQNVESWKLNKDDIDNLYTVTGNLNLQGDGWQEAFQIINEIAENAYRIKTEYITVSYLTKQLKRNSCLV